MLHRTLLDRDARAAARPQHAPVERVGDGREQHELEEDDLARVHPGLEGRRPPRRRRVEVRAAVLVGAAAEHVLHVERVEEHT